MAKQRHNPAVRAALLEVVENQIRDGTPPETRATLDRLVVDGHSREKAIEMIACVVAAEVFDVLKAKQPYQQARYVARLQQLPDMPWDDEELSGRRDTTPP